MSKTKVAAGEGLFTLGPQPHLIGGKVPGRESYFFPQDLAGADPAVDAIELEQVELSNRGTIWSYTTSEYQQPPPFQAASESYEPITIVAVRLHKEKMVVLGQCERGVGTHDLNIGDEVELVIETLYDDEENEYMVWKWSRALGHGSSVLVRR